MARSFFSRSFLALPTEEGRKRLVGLLLLFLLLFSPLDSETAGGLYPFTVLCSASLLLLVVFTWDTLATGRGFLCLNPVALSFLALLTWCGLSLFWTIDRPATEYGLLRLVTAYIVLITAVGTFRDEGEYLHLFRGAVLCGAALSLLGLAQFVLPIGRHGWRAHSLFVTPNSFAGLLLLLLPIAAALTLEAKTVRGRRLWGLTTLLMGAAFTASGSRGAWLALAAASSALLTAAALAGRLSGLASAAAGLRRHRTECLFAALIAAIVVFQILRTGEVGERFRTLRAPFSAEPDRYQYWRSTLDVARERPLVGYGLRSFHFLHPGHRSPLLDERVTIVYSHNDYLQMAAETGTAGFIFFLVLSISVGALALRTVQRTDGKLAPAAGLGLLAVMLHSIFDFDFHIPAIQVNFWILTALLVTAASGSGPRQRLFALDAGWRRWIALAMIAGTIAAAAGTVGRHYLAEHASTAGFPLLARGDFSGARERFRRAERLVPYSSFYLSGLGRVDAAEGEAKGERALLERAESAFRRALEENPFDHKAQLLLAVMLSRNLDILGEEKRSDLVEVLREGASRHPGVYAFSFHLGRVLLDGGRAAEALPPLERYLSLRPDDQGARLMLAEALLRNGDRGSARREAEKVPSDDPRSEKREALIREIEEGGER